MRKLIFMLAFLFSMGMQGVYAQETTITGTVTDDKGDEIPGANIRVKGYTDIGTITDLNGMYSISVPSDATALIVSFVGMETKEVEIAGQTTVNVQLDNEDVGLGEVVVTALGITRDQKALGYSVQGVNAEEITDAHSENIVNSLSGRVAGVSINSSAGAAGSGSTILIRGAASLDGETQPLFVIDGVPVDNSHSRDDTYATEGVDYSNRAIDINPNDIESVNVLKGGAATALYGLRAANGVIMITTKKGEKGKGLNISYDGYYSMDQVTMMHDLQNKYAQGSRGIFQQAGGTTLTWGPLISDLRYDGDQTYEYDQVNGRQVMFDDPTATSARVTPFNNVDNFFQNGHTWSHSVSMSGGNEKTSFYASFSNLSATGIQPHNEWDRTSVKITGETQLSDKMTVGGSANYTNSGGIRLQRASNISGTMLGLLRTPPNFDNRGAYLPDGSQRAYSGVYDNPFWTAENNQTKDNVHRFFGNLNLSYQFFDWLNLSYKLGLDTYTDQRTAVFAVGAGQFPGGAIRESERVRTLLNSDLFININKNITENIKTNITLGHNLFQDDYRRVEILGENFAVNGWDHIDNTADKLPYNENEKQRSSAVFGDFGFEFYNMFYLNATLRYESSTTLPESENKFLYPSVSVGFVFTELAALKSLEFLTFGKLRGSWAKNANVPTAYKTVTYYESTTYDDGFTNGIDFGSFLGTPGFGYFRELGSADLKPETQKNWEVGLDLRFFNKRLSVDFTYYNQYNEDLLVPVPIAAATGFREMYINAGEIENKGIELTIGATPIKVNDFTWDILINWTQNKSEVKKLAEGITEISQGGFTSAGVFSIVGQPTGSIFGSDFERDAQGRVIINDDVSDVGNYGYPYKSSDRSNLGSVDPDWTAGITNSFSYKGISLSFLLDIKMGGKMFNFTKARLNTQGVSKATEARGETAILEGVMGHFDANGDLVSTGQTNTIPAVLDQDWYTGLAGSSGVAQPFVEDAGWVRLRNITLGYELPSKILDKTFIKRVNVYFSGRNLWIKTDYTGIDPESSLIANPRARGFEYFNTPGTKSFTFGIKASF